MRYPACSVPFALTNLETHPMLGVRHKNGLEWEDMLKYLSSQLCHHLKYEPLF